MTKEKDLEIINNENIENMIYTIRGKKVMLDSDLANIYHYQLKAFNQQVRRNIDRFPNDMMFQLTADEVKHLRSQNVTANINSMSRSNPLVFTEQGIYMLMTVLKSEIAIKQSIALVRTFKAMKDYLSDSKILIPSDEYAQLSTITAKNTSDIEKIKSEMITKSDLNKFIKSFNDKRIAKDYVIYDGQTVEADLTYLDIYSKAKKTIYIVDNYIGLKTISLLGSVRDGVKITIFSDNIKNMLRLTDYNDFILEFKKPEIKFQITNGKFHDRYIILDYKTKSEKIYHCGASSKDAGKKITSICLIEDQYLYHNMIEELLCNPDLILK